MKDLATIQDEFQRALLDGDDTVLDDIVDSSKENRRVLLGVYRNAYVLRLIDFLANDYEKLYAFLGEEQFGGMARTFIAANPSTTTNARWYGHKLPGFLAAEPYSDMPVLADLAALELALTDVFDARDAAAIAMSDIAAVAAEDWPGLTFTPHPATRRLDLSTNANDIWRALHNDETPPGSEALSETRHLIVYRHEGMASYRPMSPDESMMWDEAANGVPFSVLCEMLSMYGGKDEAPVRAATYLRGWIDTGMLAQP